MENTKTRRINRTWRGSLFAPCM